MSASFPRKMLPLHHKITRKRTLGNRKKIIRKSSESDWKMIGKSLEDYWRTIGGLLENRERNPPLHLAPVSCDSVAGQPPILATLNAHSRAIFASVNAPARRHIVEP